MVNKFDTFRAIFVALFILKIGNVGEFTEFSWLVIFLPLVIGSVVDFSIDTISKLGIFARLQTRIGNWYLARLRDRVAKKALRRYRKEAGN